MVGSRCPSMMLIPSWIGRRSTTIVESALAQATSVCPRTGPPTPSRIFISLAQGVVDTCQFNPEFSHDRGQAMATKNASLLRLQQHAGLPTAGDDIPQDTLAEFIFQTQRGGTIPCLDSITTDIIDCLDHLNRQVNQGAGPQAHGTMIDRQVVYAVSGIVWACLDKALELRRADATSTTASDLLSVAWRVQCAWDALVAGDVESLQSHVISELEARAGKDRS